MTGGKAFTPVKKPCLRPRQRHPKPALRPSRIKKLARDNMTDSQRSVGLQGARKRRHESHSPDGYGQNSRLATPNFGHKDLPAELTGRADVRYASLSSHSSYSSRPVAHQMHPSLYPLGPLGYCQNVYPPMQSTAASSTLLYSYNHPAGFTDSRHPPPNYRPSQY